MTETRYVGEVVKEGGNTYYPEKHKSFVFMNADMNNKDQLQTEVVTQTYTQP